MNNDLLDKITESTLKNKGPLWLENLLINEKEFGFQKTIKDIERLYRKIVFKKITPCELSLLFENTTTIQKLQTQISKNKKFNKYISDFINVNQLKIAAEKKLNNDLRKCISFPF